MDIVELGAIGELVGGVAVIASLVFVGLQVRQSNTVAKAESIRTVSTEAAQAFLTTCDPELVRVVRRGVQDFASLTHNEQSVASGFLAAVFVNAQTTFSVRSSSRPSRMEQIGASWIAAPGLRPWWQAAQDSFSPAFVRQLEELAQEGAPPIDERWPWFALDEDDRRIDR